MHAMRRASGARREKKEYGSLVRPFLMGDFFFQAEDGIRDVERSRGLGDVYKRQGITSAK